MTSFTAHSLTVTLHLQDQSTYPAPAHGPAATMTSKPGNNGMAVNHGNTAYLNSQAAAAAARKQQQQILEQQKQQFMQRQQLMAEQVSSSAGVSL